MDQIARMNKVTFDRDENATLFYVVELRILDDQSECLDDRSYFSKIFVALKLEFHLSYCIDDGCLRQVRYNVSHRQHSFVLKAGISAVCLFAVDFKSNFHYLHQSLCIEVAVDIWESLD